MPNVWGNLVDFARNRSVSLPKPTQSQDGQAHLAYFDVRTQASFVWDGKSEVIEVSIGGYGEPVDHTIPVELDMSDPIDQMVFGFAWLCQEHAKELPDYGSV